MIEELRDDEIVDVLLKDKGTSRKQLSEQVREERRLAKERLEREKEEARKAEEAERARALNAQLVKAYNENVVIFVDQTRLPETIKDLGELTCPHCKAPVSAFADLIRVALAQMSRVLSHTTVAGRIVEITAPFPTLKGVFACEGCGHELEVLLATGAPIKGPRRAPAKGSR